MGDHIKVLYRMRVIYLTCSVISLHVLSKCSVTNHCLIFIEHMILIKFFFFLISKNVIYTNGYSMHEEHGANPENTRRKKQRKNKKRKPIHRLITILIKILWDEISEHISQNSDNEFE